MNYRTKAINFLSIPQKYLNRGLSYDDLEVHHINKPGTKYEKGKPDYNADELENMEWLTPEEHAIEHIIHHDWYEGNPFIKFNLLSEEGRKQAKDLCRQCGLKVANWWKQLKESNEEEYNRLIQQRNEAGILAFAKTKERSVLSTKIGIESRDNRTGIFNWMDTASNEEKQEMYIARAVNTTKALNKWREEHPEEAQAQRIRDGGRGLAIGRHSRYFKKAIKTHNLDSYLYNKQELIKLGLTKEDLIYYLHQALKELHND